MRFFVVIVIYGDVVEFVLGTKTSSNAGALFYWRMVSWVCIVAKYSVLFLPIET
jgi:hypothetical protein